MKKIDLGQAITILANIGVIVGIIFLALELQQNNQLLQSQLVLAQSEWRRDFDNRIIVNADLAELLVKARNREELSEAETLRLSRIAQDMFSVAEMNFTLSGNSLDDCIGFRRMFEGNSILPAEMFREAWNNSSSNRDQDFVRSVESECI